MKNSAIMKCREIPISTANQFSCNNQLIVNFNEKKGNANIQF